MRKELSLSIILTLPYTPLTAAFVGLHELGARPLSARRPLHSALPAKTNCNVEEAPSRNPLYKALATPDESKCGRSDFFYNDEVISHLHGYMLLVGLFAAQDEDFLISFLVFAGMAAAATLAETLPANPRVPALVAAATFVTTLACRSLLPYEPLFKSSFDKAPYFEALVCFLNIAWGVWGTWKTKKKTNGATMGF